MQYNYIKKSKKKTTNLSILLINKPGRKKNIIWIEFTESLYKLYYNTF